jgi:hypothetical protein
MLPPVRTISGSSGSYQNSSSVAASAHLTGEPIFQGHAADAERDVNPNLAGKLNILLMSGRDLVAEDLAMLADALGKEIDLPRASGETSAVYVRRLAEALANLSGHARAEAEKQLNLIIRGVRLEAVIKAFLNPTGPEAARIVALLEMAGLKDMDLATRTVLTSYRQNSGADISLDTPAQVSTSGSGPAASGAGQAAVPASSNANTGAGQTPTTQGQSSATAGEMPLIIAEEFDDEPELVTFHPETDNIFSRTSSEPLRGESRPSAFAASFAVLDKSPPPRTDTVAPRGSTPGVAVDARRLQSILDAAFDAGENSDPIIQAKAAIELLASEDEQVPRPSPAPQPHSRMAEPMVKPFIDYTRPPPRPGLQQDFHTAILALKGWTEDDGTGLPLLPASLEAEVTLAAALSPHAGPEPDLPESVFALRGRGIAANDDRHKSALAAAEQQLLRTADEAAGLAADRRLDQGHASGTALSRNATDSMIAAALQLGHDPRLGVGYATVPYPLADERDEGRGDRSGYRSQTGEEEAGEDAASESWAEEEASGEEEEHGEEAGEYLDAPGYSASASSDEAPEISDPAFDLYQRMAGWS